MILYTLLFFMSFVCTNLSAATILLDPAGDAHSSGRKVHTTFEHGLSMQCAQALQQKIKELYPQHRILISRAPGESVDHMQRINFSNRLQVDLFIHISFSAQTNNQYTLNIYRYCAEPTDDWNKKTDALTFIPLHQAHLRNNEINKQMSNILYKKLSEIKWLKVETPLAIPHKPLLGITSPALAVEIGIPESLTWKPLIDPLVNTLCNSLKENISNEA